MPIQLDGLARQHFLNERIFTGSETLFLLAKEYLLTLSRYILQYLLIFTFNDLTYDV